MKLEAGGKAPGDLKEWTVKEFSGKRIGFMGLCEEEWIEELSPTVTEKFLWEDYV